MPNLVGLLTSRGGLCGGRGGAGRSGMSCDSGEGLRTVNEPPAVERNGVNECGGIVFVWGRWSSMLGKEVVHVEELSREC